MTTDPVLLLAGAGALGLVALLTLLAGLVLGGGRSQGRRLDAVVERARGAAAVTATLRRDDSDSTIPGLDRLVKRYLPRRAALRQRLARTGRGLSPGQYVLLCAALALLGALLANTLLKLPSLPALLLGTVFGLALPHGWTAQLIRRRADRFVGQFPDAIDLIVRGLKSGLPIHETIGAIARELPEPLGNEFRAIDAGLKLGQTLDEALWQSADRIAAAEYRFFVISLSVQRETGGNLAETLSNLSDLLRRRRQMKLKIRAVSSEARASAYIIGSLPFVMGGVLYLINPGYVGELFADPRGHVMVGISVFLMGLGGLIMFKMTQFEI